MAVLHMYAVPVGTTAPVDFYVFIPNFLYSMISSKFSFNLTINTLQTKMQKL